MIKHDTGSWYVIYVGRGTFDYDPQWEWQDAHDYAAAQASKLGCDVVVAGNRWIFKHEPVAE